MINRLRIQVTVLFVSIVVHIGSVQATPGLVLPVERTTGQGCIPEGRAVDYECTVSDDGSRLTIWRGSAFNCSSSLINLAHSLYVSNGDSDTCGDLSAMSVGVSGNNFTSILTLKATIGLNGMTIECTRSGTVLVGNDTLKSGAPPSPPQHAIVNITPTASLTVSWKPPSDTRNLEGYMFTVTGEDCGCVSMNVSTDNTSVLCSGWIVNNQICSFEVRSVSQDCGFTSDAMKKFVVLIVPPAPTQLRVVFGAYQIEVEFVQSILSPIGSNLAIAYTVMVVGTNSSMNFTRVICDNNRCNLTIPNSQLSRSTYNVSYMYIVSVVASNIFGFGPSAVYVECNPEDLGNSTFLNGQGMVNVANGLIHYSGVSPDSIATLQCNDGYRADSFLNRTCMFGGRWSDEALECVIMEEGTEIRPTCHLYCALLVGVFVFEIVLVLIIACIAIALYILKKYGRERYASNNTSEKVQLQAVNRESPTTNDLPLSPVDMQPSKAKINVHRSEPSKSAQVDTYANREDFIKTPPHMQPQKQNEGAEPNLITGVGASSMENFTQQEPILLSICDGPIRIKQNEAYDPVTLLTENDAYNILNIRSGTCSQMTERSPSPPHIYDEPMLLTRIPAV